MPRTIVQAGLIAGIALFVAGPASAREDNAIFVQIQPTATAPAAEASVDAQKSAAAALLAKAKRDGGVRVIAELRVAPRFGNPLAARGDVQPATVVRVQTAVLARVLKNAPADGVRRFQFIPFIAANVDAAQLERLLADPALVSLEEDVAAKPSAVQWNIAEIKAPPVWRVGVKGAGYAVAVLDSGVQIDHPIFQGRVVSEACYSTNDPRGSVSFCPNGKSSSTAKNSGRNCPVSIDGCEHGTHVAGIAVGYSAQSQGVATEAKLIVIQIASKGIVPAVCGGHAPCIATLESDQIAALERVSTLSLDL